MHAAEAVLRDTEYSLLLTFGSSGEPFEQRVRALSGKVDGLLVAEEVLAVADLRRLAGRIPVVVIAGRRRRRPGSTSCSATTPAASPRWWRT